MPQKKDDKKSKEIAKKGTITSAKKRAIRKKIKEVIATGDIDNLQDLTLENWVELLNDEDKQVRAFATKEVSKYQFATKKETTKFPAININCNFIGIKNEQE